MLGRTLSHYEIIDEIDRGGMGVIYRARDLKLDREVAIKVLPPELVSDPERKRRFIQEAKAAAKLEHPHIAVVHEIDEVDGVTFIAMELIRGERLRDAMEREHLPLARSLELATEVAEGLARAHDQGIVHRDMKPGNVMVTEDGHAKIIDFGLAKLIEPLAGKDSEASTSIREETKSGMVMGTLSYMSPEQARGRKVDRRSDIFSFGIVLHELLSGSHPFRAPSAPEVLNAIINTSPSRLEEDVDGALQRIVDKCLAKEPSERYQGMKDVAVDLRAARLRLESGAVATAPKPSRSIWIGVSAAAAVLLLALGVWLLWPTEKEVVAPTEPTKSSIAVLYFENASGDPELDWLRTGLTEMLVTDLAQLPNIKVLSTSRLFQILKDLNKLDERITSLDVIQEVAQRADSETVILGSYMKAGDNIRINIELQNPSDGSILTTEKVEGVGESSLFSMVDNLTSRIGRSFGPPKSAKYTSDGLVKMRPLGELTTQSIEAYRYMNEAFNMVMRGQSKQALDFIEKALEEDPNCAEALAGAAIMHNNLGHQKRASEYFERAFEQIDRVRPATRYRLEAWTYLRNEETYGEAIEACRKLLELNPDDRPPRHWLARTLLKLERLDEAIEHWEWMRERKHPGAMMYGSLADAYALRGELDRATEVWQEYIERFPDRPAGYRGLALALIWVGKLDEALDAILKEEALRPRQSPFPCGTVENRYFARGMGRSGHRLWEERELLATIGLLSDSTMVNPTARWSSWVTGTKGGRGRPLSRSAEQRSASPCFAGPRRLRTSASEKARAVAKRAVPVTLRWEGIFLESLASANLGRMRRPSRRRRD